MTFTRDCGLNCFMYKLHEVSGTGLIEHQNDIMNLRMGVFREWPYLYEGDVEYEKQYLQPFIEHPESMCVLCLSPQNQVVGISTAMPLAAEHKELTTPIKEHGLDIDEIYYLGESCIHPEHRGHGLYKHLFSKRLNKAQELGYKQALFCGVVRDPDHPHRPKNYTPLDNYWKSQGFTPIPDLYVYFEWQDIDKTEPTKKPLQVWLKSL